MTLLPGALAMAGNSRQASYDLVLLAHVLVAFVGFGAIVVAGANAMALRRPGPIPDSVRRYYRPGVNWPGRVLYLVPVLGVALILMSHGDWSFSDGWIIAGLALWAFAAVVAEMSLWPAERRLQVAVAGTPTVHDDVASSPPVADMRSQCSGVVAMAALLFAVLVAATYLMVAKP